MKHSVFTLGAMLAATFALSSCNESLSPVQPTEGVPFEISTLLTKTANDGLSTVWASGDAINLFHAEAGTTTYTSDGQFTVDEALTGVFSGTLESALEEGKSYDWYANYPYSSHITTPANTSGYAYIGGRSDKSQTQTGNDSKAHLAGSACPLYGVAKSVASDVKPAIEMKQLASVVAIKVTNTLEDALTVSSVSFTSSEDIVGQYYIDYSGDAPAYKAGTYVSSTANLSVTDGTAIAQNSSAVFYIALKPHTAESGSTLKISVNGVEKTLTLTKDVTFTAGRIKTLEYKYAPTAGEETIVINNWNTLFGTSQNGSKSVNKNALTLTGTSADITVTAKNGNSTNSYIKDTDFRLYNGYTLTVSVPEGKKITKIVTTKGGKTFSTGITSDTGTVSISSSSMTWTSGTGVNSVVFTISDTISFASMTVTYN